MFKRLVVTTLIAATALLTGCGRTPGALAPAPKATQMSASDVVGVPVSYRAGVSYPGMAGVPSLKRATFPRFTRTSGGKASDPVNLLVAGSERQVRHVFGATGWVGADAISPGSVARTIKAGLTGGEYLTSPMSALFLYNRIQDMSWQKGQVSVIARDHLRVWETPLRDGVGRPFWAIAATKDVALKRGPDEKLVTHQISPDIDAERQLVVDDLLASGHVQLRYQLQVHKPFFKGVNGGGDEYFTDGKVEVLELVVMK